VKENSSLKVGISGNFEASIPLIFVSEVGVLKERLVFGSASSSTSSSGRSPT
jgi:hypothetical protein